METRLIYTLLLLIVLTLMSFYFAETDAQQTFRLKLMILSLAAIKAHFLIDRFMGLSAINSAWRSLILIYPWLVLGLVALLHFLN